MFKLKIKVKRINHNIPLPKIIAKGEWIDLCSAETVSLKKGEVKRIGLGVAMKLPNGFEAPLICRSSTPSKFGIELTNCLGLIDNSFSGNEDEWKFEAKATRATTIAIADRICQFRIQLSQKATIWQKLMWLFSDGVEIVEVDDLDNPSRGGYGTTGKNLIS